MVIRERNHAIGCNIVCAVQFISAFFCELKIYMDYFVKFTRLC